MDGYEIVALRRVCVLRGSREQTLSLSAEWVFCSSNADVMRGVCGRRLVPAASDCRHSD